MVFLQKDHTNGFWDQPLKVTIFFLALCIGILSSQLAESQLIRVVPEPQRYTKKTPPFNVTLSDDWVIVYYPSTAKIKDNRDDIDPYYFAAIYLQKKLLKFGLNIKIVKDDNMIYNGKPKIIIGNSLRNYSLKRLLSQINVSFLEIPYSSDDPRLAESYIFDVSKIRNEENILIAATGGAGAFYGVNTLLQLLSPLKDITGSTIIDYPDMRWRGVFLKFRHLLNNERLIKEKDLQCVIDKIDEYSELKLNTIFFAGSLYWSMDGYQKIFLQQIFTECRKRFITPIPVIGSKLWNIPKEKIIYEAIEGVWTKKEKFYFGHDDYVNPLKSVKSIIKNGSFDSCPKGNEGQGEWKLSKLDQHNYWQKISIHDSGENKDSVHTGNFAIKCVTNNLVKPYLLKLKYLSGESGTLIPVEPDSYYELNFWVKRGSRPGNRISISVKQYDINAHLLEQTGNYINNLHLWKKWRSRWIPVFTHPDCHFLKIAFLPSSKGSISGEIYLDDVNLYRMNGLLLNVLRKANTDIVVTNKDDSIVFQEGKDYTVRDVSSFYILPDQPLSSLNKTRIKRTPNSQIPPGAIVNITYDSITLEPRTIPRSKYCPSCIETYRAYQKVFSELLALKPKYLHLCLDEHHGGYNRDSRCRQRNMTNAEIFANFINNLNNILHSNEQVEVLSGTFIQGLGQPEIRLIMWDDMVNNWHNGGNEFLQVKYGGLPGKTYLAMPDTPVNSLFAQRHKTTNQHITSNIIMASWWYKDDRLRKIKNSPAFFEKRDFDYFACTWDDKQNIKLWSKRLCNTNTLGMIASTWDDRREGISWVAEYSWKNAGKARGLH